MCTCTYSHDKRKPVLDQEDDEEEEGKNVIFIAQKPPQEKKNIIIIARMLLPFPLNSKSTRESIERSDHRVGEREMPFNLYSISIHMATILTRSDAATQHRYSISIHSIHIIIIIFVVI